MAAFQSARMLEGVWADFPSNSNLAQWERMPQFPMMSDRRKPGPGGALGGEPGEVPPLQMTPEVMAELRVHGEEAWPQECCGVLVGRAARGAGGW